MIGTSQKINIKNQTYFFFNHVFDIDVFDSNLIKIDTKLYKNIDIYYIGYITIKKIDDYENTFSLNPLYLMIGKVGRNTEERNGSKYLVFDYADEIREVLEKYTELWKMKLRP